MKGKYHKGRLITRRWGSSGRGWGLLTSNLWLLLGTGRSGVAGGANPPFSPAAALLEWRLETQVERGAKFFLFALGNLESGALTFVQPTNPLWLVGPSKTGPVCVS